jgi:tetratricopeptide (TPR) repeat protein
LWAAPQARAWHHLRAAQSDLEHFRAAPARAHLRVCLEVWPSSARTHLLAARAARMAGAFDEAEEHLRQAQRLGQLPPEDVAFEWALYRAARGDLDEVDQYLEARARKNPGEVPLICEALTRGYLCTFRTLGAVGCADRWLRLQPDCLAALALRGKVWLAAHAADKGLPDLQRAVAGDPADAEARRDLALALLETRQDEKALPHLEHLRALRPGDPDILVRIARCHQTLGRTEEALALLDAVLAEHPRHGLALATRGQMALAAERFSEAEKWLRQAVEVVPQDHQAQWALYRALVQQGKKAEAGAQRGRAQQAEDRAEKLGEITTRKMSQRPHDPALHAELGVLLIQTGQKEVGKGWLESALGLDPGCRPAHAALADYYEAEGDAERAAYHRQRAK